MSDAAAFFAKKKKKKAFKFNANLVDASSVTATVHVDAPALSTEQSYQPQAPQEQHVLDGTAVNERPDPVTASSSVTTADPRNGAPPSTTTTTITTMMDGGDWDEDAMAVSSALRSSSSTAHHDEKVVLDMKTLDTGHHQNKGGRFVNDNNNIAEKLRVQETKAQLAAAREGMEREAMKLKEERERKNEQEKAASSSRFGAAAAALSSSSTSSSAAKWVPPHLRSGGAAAGGLAARGWGGASSTARKKLDVQDEELFPDLASADKILEQKEKESKPVVKAPKKTPIGGGASWASKMSAKKTPAPEAEPEPEPPVADNKPETVEPPVTETVPAATAPAPTPTAEAPKPVKKVTKKKKKDLSTFKVGGT